MKKQEVLETIANLPDEFETNALEELIEKMILLEKIKEGDKALAEGRTMTLEELRKRFEEKWQNLP